MAIDKFSKQQFEDALFTIYPMTQSLGLDKGEETYAIQQNDYARLIVRSSVDSSGYAADTSEDSIRLWLQAQLPNGQWVATGKKVDAYTTRVNGWESRLETKIRTLWERLILFRNPVTNCPECGEVRYPKIVNKDNGNQGRPFMSCCDSFEWLDTPVIENGSKIEFDDFSEQEGMHVSDHEGANEATAQVIIDDSIFDMPETKDPNPQQLKAIQSPIDQDIRIFAPPGSGKTFVIEHRYKFMVDQGVDPNSILVVTFSKAMADEMGQRIHDTCPTANREQISTIHAFCYRLLAKWFEDSPYYRWSVAGSYNSPFKSWQVKQTIDDLVSRAWDEEKPGYQEVLDWIQASKHYGIMANDCLEWYTERLGSLYGKRLAFIRQAFDKEMYSRECMMFGDMLLLTENWLKDDSFRLRCHKKFEHVIIDEAQDTNGQALRILIGIALNKVIEKETK